MVGSLIRLLQYGFHSYGFPPNLRVVRNIKNSNAPNLGTEKNTQTPLLCTLGLFLCVSCFVEHKFEAVANA